ncbi:hypothetical protein CFR74_10660 [Novacetimonas hansenii]|nr:hypothetical protein CFR74_10660 [Novacetimonas hansenii]
MKVAGSEGGCENSPIHLDDYRVGLPFLVMAVMEAFFGEIFIKSFFMIYATLHGGGVKQSVCGDDV